jgi:hypothetical protein
MQPRLSVVLERARNSRVPEGIDVIANVRDEIVDGLWNGAWCSDVGNGRSVWLPNVARDVKNYGCD